MQSHRTLLFVFSIVTLLAIALSTLAARRYSEPFPPLAASLSTPLNELSDFVCIAFGFRKLASDIAWVQTLIYYGTPEQNLTPEEAEEAEQGGGGHYPLFLAHCQRAAHIDPYFKYVYFYGGGVLGWNLNRLDEAEILLREGIRWLPKEWRFQQFLAGLAFQKNHNISALAEFLREYAYEPDCPNLLRSILANIYKKEKRYSDAIQIWVLVVNTGDSSYMQRATSQILEMAPLAKQMGQTAH